MNLADCFAPARVSLLATIAVALVACTTARERPAAETGASFPHDDTIMLPGIDVQAIGACFDCHAAGAALDSGGDIDSAVPHCDSCHVVFPHFGDCIPTHGGEWLEDPGACSVCHGESGDKDPSTSSVDTCVGCHSAYPHLSGWVMPDTHGARVVERGSDTSCASCHQAADCQSCHAAYPHADDIVSNHSDASGGAGCGGFCHDGSQPDAPGEITCADCHGDQP